MKVRADIADLLRAGVPQIHICRQLHVAQLTVQRTREALHLPAPKSCRVLPASLEEAFQQYARPTENGHVEWAGHLRGGIPSVTFQGTVHSASRLAFLFHHGRQPSGPVKTSCPVKGCVRGGHLTDQPMRDANKRADRAYAAIFGAVAS